MPQLPLLQLSSGSASLSLQCRVSSEPPHVFTATWSLPPPLPDKPLDILDTGISGLSSPEPASKAHMSLFPRSFLLGEVQPSCRWAHEWAWNGVLGWMFVRVGIETEFGCEDWSAHMHASCHPVEDRARVGSKGGRAGSSQAPCPGTEPHGVQEL